MKTTKYLLVLGMMLSGVFAHAEVTCSARNGAPATQNDARSKSIVAGTLAGANGQSDADAADAAN